MHSVFIKVCIVFLAIPMIQFFIVLNNRGKRVKQCLKFPRRVLINMNIAVNLQIKVVTLAFVGQEFNATIFKRGELVLKGFNRTFQRPFDMFFRLGLRNPIFGESILEPTQLLRSITAKRRNRLL